MGSAIRIVTDRIPHSSAWEVAKSDKSPVRSPAGFHFGDYVNQELTKGKVTGRL
jgi:hypothetical protein